MGRHVPPRVAYWTSGYAPTMEAISGQVALLRRNFPGSVAWGMNPKKTCQLSWRGGIVVHPRLWLPFHAVTCVLQSGFNLNHIVGGLGDWHYLKAAHLQPILLTLAVKSEPADRNLLDKVEGFIVEWHRDVEWMERHGVSRDRVHVIPPPVDLSRFCSKASPTGPFTVLFASSPDSVEALQERGVDLILDAAALRPHYRFTLLWRPWGDSLAAVQSWIRERDLRNVTVLSKAVSRMEDVYSAVHATIAPFRNLGNTKAVPNSLVESLASGRPVITTESVSMAKDLQDSSAGRLAIADGNAIASALDEIRVQWHSMTVAAQDFAVRHFDERSFISAHNKLYSEVMK